MKQYTLTEAAEALTTDLKSLKRWIDLEEWDIEKQVTKYDKRVKYLTEEQVKNLANVHQRMWPPRVKTPEELAESAGLAGAVNILREHVDDLKANHVGTTLFSTTEARLEARIDDLERKYATTLEQLTEALLAIKELQDWKAAQESRPKPGRKPKAEAATGND